MPSSYGSDASKSALRKEYIAALRSFVDYDRYLSDSRIMDQLERVKEFAQAPVVLAFVSSDFEIDTHALIRKLLLSGRRVAVPLVDPKTKTMSFYEIEDFSELTSGSFGILEPSSTAKELSVPEMVNSACLVPGLCFDGEGRRLGRGGGYYDKFLCFYPGHKIALARRIQISNNPLPVDPHDIRVDIVVSEDFYWHCTSIR